MEQKELTNLWQTVLGEIETEVSKANFITLFKPTALLSFDKENIATVAAQSSMIIDLLQRRFYNMIKSSLDKHTKSDVKIVFVPKAPVKEEQQNKSYPLFTENMEASAPLIGHLPRVRAEYAFENMAVSSSNQLAYVSAKTVAEKPGTAYNPLFIYGPVGVGKTHLMQAIANEVYKKSPAKKIVYLTSEEFTNEVVEAIRTNTTGYMKRKFRSLDLLIIDDIQFVAGKEKVQEELFHTFNILVDKGAQIVLSSDRPPTEIKKVEKRLLSRFSGGLTVDIESPDFELRTAILLIKARKHNFDLSIEAAKKIAEKEMDARSLEGILLRVITEGLAGGKVIEEGSLEEILNRGREERPQHHHPDDLIKNVCNYYQIKPTQLKGERRNASLVKARHITMYMLKKDYGLTFSEIGNLLGGRDHTTIMHGVDKITGLVDNSIISDDILGISRLKENRIGDY